MPLLDPDRLSSVLRVHAPLAAVTVVLTIAVAATVAALRPERYTVRVPVLVDASAASAPSATATGRAPLLATQADVVSSGRVALKVVDALRLAEVGGPRPVEPTPAGTSPRHDAADRLLARLAVTASSQSGVLEIAYTGDDPAAAVRTADAFARAYVDTLAEIRADAHRRALLDGVDPRSTGLARLDATVLDTARRPAAADGPGPVAAAVLALPLAVLLALLAVVVAERRRPRIHVRGDLARLTAPAEADVLHDAFDGRAPALPARTGGGPAFAGDGVETGIFAPRVGAADPRPRGGDGAGAPGAGSVRPDGRSPAQVRAVPAFASADARERTPTSAAGRPEPAAPSPAAPSHASPSAAAPSAAASPERAPIGQMLVQAGLIHPPEVERTLAWARQEGLRFGEAAVARRLVTPDQLERVLQTQFDYPTLQSGRSAVRPEVVAAFDVRNRTVADLRRLRARLDGGPLAAGARRCVAVLGAGPASGCSFVAANLAVCLAQAGRRTLLVDADLRSGRQHEMFGQHNRSGLAAMLNRRVEAGTLQPVGGLPTLTLLASGPLAPNPAELLSRDALGQLLASFGRAFDAVVLDTCGDPDEPDARLVARAAGAAVLVARRGAAARDTLADTVQALLDDRTTIAATLLNRH